MTRRQVRGASRAPAMARPPELRRHTFPALTSFVRGYLHEDFLTVHGSVRAAATAFCAEASVDERRRLAEELTAVVGTFANRSMRDLRRFVTGELGGAWHPQSQGEIVELADLIRSAT